MVFKRILDAFFFIVDASKLNYKTVTLQNGINAVNTVIFFRFV